MKIALAFAALTRPRDSSLVGSRVRSTFPTTYSSCQSGHRARMATKEIIDFSLLEPEIQKLITESVAVREFSYSPYSKFKVGAALLCDDGTISRGCNVENSSYPVGVCAERSAIAKAISEGKKKFRALSVVADLGNGGFTAPCGMCRQAIAEFGDIPVYLTRSDAQRVLRTKVSELLPLSFFLSDNQAP